MYRFLFLLLFVLPLPAQSPQSNLDKPPQDIDDALRARIAQFYDYHVQATPSAYRKAEQLVAEESKDDYYVMGKMELKKYKIASIEYSENFNKAKAMIVGAVPAMLPMAGPKIMDIPFASYWKVENGVWFWYYNKEVARETPFGRLKEPPPNANSGTTPTAAPAPPNPESLLASLQSALKIDRNRIGLVPGEPQTVRVTNTLPGPASLSISCPYAPLSRTGVTATFDRKDLKGNETAVLTLTADPHADPGSLPLQITVSPTNQVLNLTVTISPR